MEKDPNQLYLTILLLLISYSVIGQIRIIPQPNEIQYGKGSFLLSQNIQIVIKNETSEEAAYLSDVLKNDFNRNVKTNHEGKGIQLSVNSKLEPDLGEEGYQLSIKKDNILIQAAHPTGVFYGIQSLRQIILQSEIEKRGRTVYKIPTLKITDRPTFVWRDFMLDESRHFKGKNTVKKLLDQMALLKMNVFHWHLTDDQGWRIEIKKYPKLTEIGSKRKDTQTQRDSEARTGETHQGYYTQEEIKEIIAYAKKRKILIVPEIEMPGHATAAIAAYPWVGSLGTTKEVAVTFGKLEDSFNIADPKVVQFLKDILDEVTELFPGDIIHIGGDEVNFDAWKNSKHIKKFMENKGLKSPVDLQIYFTNEISQYIDQKGKRMMGWNDILGDDIHKKGIKASNEKINELAESTIIHFWKGDLDLIEKATSQGYDVVNSNHWDTYLDYTYKVIPLSKAYSFNPIPEGLNPNHENHILGIGAQMWSEWIPTVLEMENQIFPRLAAYAEVGWTQLKNKDYNEFKKGLQYLERYWNTIGIHYHKTIIK